MNTSDYYDYHDNNLQVQGRINAQICHYTLGSAVRALPRGKAIKDQEDMLGRLKKLIRYISHDMARVQTAWKKYRDWLSENPNATEEELARVRRSDKEDFQHFQLETGTAEIVKTYI